MSRPDDIPEAIWDVASTLAHHWCHEDYAPEGEAEMADEIARAIMATKAEERAISAVLLKALKCTRSVALSYFSGVGKQWLDDADAAISQAEKAGIKPKRTLAEMRGVFAEAYAKEGR
jgi:hypothetical protein